MSNKIKFDVKSGNQIVTELTHDEIAAIRDENINAMLMERSRPLTEQEVTKLLIKQQINTLEVDDNTALRMLEFYPEWTVGQTYSAGYKVQYGSKLWRCIQAHTSQDSWAPSIDTASLWERIDEEYTGDMYDPIPYDGNMALESGKYYVQNDVVYLCNRDTGIPVYNTLAELVGLYVEVAEQLAS